jgi:uncharacterized protein YifE (UPF0438 family)
MRLIFTTLLLLLSSCSFVKNAIVQSEYARIQSTDPSMLNLKHMVERETYFVYGLAGAEHDRAAGQVLSVAAFSDRFHPHELVDAMHQVLPGTHYGLNLPPGAYELVVFSDRNGNGILESHEVVTRRALELPDATNAPKVRGQVDLEVGATQTLEWPVSLKMQKRAQREQSLFFPPNTIRSLDDALFDRDMSTLGMYHPAAFLEKAGTMFYALEEDIGYKIPVIFVHGIDGSARDFSDLVDKLDRTRFKPWFFHYPSGGDLHQMADFFYRIFLSGKVIPVDEYVPMVIVAHSMGGIVVREALNQLEDGSKRDITFISLASPFGGMASAEAGTRNGLLVLPSWRDLSPGNAFIQQLYRKPLPSNVTSRLVYAYGNPNMLKLGEASDGVVPLSSQLPKVAQQQARDQIGINASHTGVLKDLHALEYLVNQLDRLRTRYPDPHMGIFMQGGFDRPLGSHYTKMEAYILRHYGHFLRALVQHQLEPLTAAHQGIVDVAEGRRTARSEPESAWVKFAADFPQESRVGAGPAH